MKSEDCLPAKRELLPGAELVEHFFQSRRSIRAFQKRTVERGILTRLIEIARYAPSGHNLQPVQWLVIEDPAEVRNLATLIVDGMRLLVKEKPEMAIPLHMDLAVASWERGDEVIFRGAPHVIVACASETPTAQTDCIIALTHLELAAPCLGLGACWSGYFNLVAAFYPPVNLALGLPKGHQSFGGMMVGFPKYKYYRIPLRHEPKISWR
jgi:nitroreductase